MANKIGLRKQALTQRNALSDGEAAQLNLSLLERFKQLDLSKIKSIHIFLPIVHKKEPNTLLIIEWLKLHHPHIIIVVPKADFKTNVMASYVFRDISDLKNNAYQIPEPQNAVAFHEIPDMVIIPLLAFDEKGYRVGYGKGFYDRFLQNLSTQKVGLSFFEAGEEINDVHLNDIRLDKCITPTTIYNFILS